MTLYHGSHNNMMGTGKAHEGMCFVDSIDIAENYGNTMFSLDIDGLDIVEVDGYDREENTAPADSEEFRAKYVGECDLLMYEDEDVNGNAHTCYRVISDRAIELVALVED